MQTGENEQALRKIIDFTRFLGVLVLILHFYFSCYGAFRALHISYSIVDKVLVNIYRLPVFKRILFVKSIAIGFLIISLIGTKGKKVEHIKFSNALTYTVLGLLLYYASAILFKLQASHLLIATLYISVTTVGFLLFLTGISMMYRIINVSLSNDVFNNENETFPQEERKLENEYSINLPARYNLKGKLRNSFISIVNPFRGVLVLGNPGSTCLEKAIS
ncbi:MAG: conjugal transfer protein TraG [Mucilaginibacter sp.]|nr:conjugal transfer protein TraG [Mucilaginibacter sp.]